MTNPIWFVLVDRVGREKREKEGKPNWYPLIADRGYGSMAGGDFLRPPRNFYFSNVEGEYVGLYKDLSQDPGTIDLLYQNGWEVYQAFMQLMPDSPLILGNNGALLRRIKAPAASQKIETLEES